MGKKEVKIKIIFFEIIYKTQTKKETKNKCDSLVFAIRHVVATAIHQIIILVRRHARTAHAV